MKLEWGHVLKCGKSLACLHLLDRFFVDSISIFLRKIGYLVWNAYTVPGKQPKICLVPTWEKKFFIIYDVYLVEFGSRLSGYNLRTYFYILCKNQTDVMSLHIDSIILIFRRTLASVKFKQSVIIRNSACRIQRLNFIEFLWYLEHSR